MIGLNGQLFHEGWLQNNQNQPSRPDLVSTTEAMMLDLSWAPIRRPSFATTGRAMPQKDNNLEEHHLKKGPPRASITIKVKDQ